MSTYGQYVSKLVNVEKLLAKTKSVLLRTQQLMSLTVSP